MASFPTWDFIIHRACVERMKQETKLDVTHVFIPYSYFRDNFCI